MNEDLTLQISNAFSDTGAYKELTKLLFVSNILGKHEVEELVDRLEAFITQEVKEIIEER